MLVPASDDIQYDIVLRKSTNRFIRTTIQLHSVVSYTLQCSMDGINVVNQEYHRRSMTSVKRLKKRNPQIFHCKSVRKRVAFYVGRSKTPLTNSSQKLLFSANPQDTDGILESKSLKNKITFRAPLSFRFLCAYKHEPN